jgi:hypothetical protein
LAAAAWWAWPSSTSPWCGRRQVHGDAVVCACVGVGVGVGVGIYVGVGGWRRGAG